MKYKLIIKTIAISELLIGFITLLSLMIYSFYLQNPKPVNIFIFVLISNLISIILGAGIIYCKERARQMLVFFSGYVLITKLMMIFGLLNFTGEIITFIKTDFKNYISIIYHGIVIILLNQINIKKYFN